MKIVIAGASGFIGKAVAEKLLNGGNEVTALTRDEAKSRGVIDKRARVVKWESGEDGAWEGVIDGTDCIINLAGESLVGLWTDSKKDRIRQSRIGPTKALIAAIKKASRRPRVMVQASAIGFYGDGGDEDITEDSPKGEGFLADVCEEWETAASEVRACGVRLVIMRSGVVLGLGGGMLDIMVKAYKGFLGGYAGSGRQWFSWISLADEAAAIEFLLACQSCQGVYNLTSPGPVRMKELCEMIADRLRRPNFHLPGMVARMVGGEAAQEIVLRGARVLPKRLAGTGFRFNNATIESVFSEIFAHIG